MIDVGVNYLIEINNRNYVSCKCETCFLWKNDIGENFREVNYFDKLNKFFMWFFMKFIIT